MFKKRRKPDRADATERVGSAERASFRTGEKGWWSKLLLVLTGTVLLSAAYAPFNAFWAAWIGLVPLLIAVLHTRTGVRAFFWGWFAGIIFFIANMWWMVFITGPGMVALMAWAGLHSAIAAALLRPVLLRVHSRLQPIESPSKGQTTSQVDPSPPAARLIVRPLPLTWGLAFVATLAAVWVGLEWVRGSWPWDGLQWLYLYHTQTPVLPLCQIADLTGGSGVSFWVMAVNATVTLYVLDGWRLRPVWKTAVATGVLTVAIAAYGVWRFAETDRHLTPGPKVLVVQSNFPQDNSGNKGATPEETLEFHVSQTEAALRAEPDTDLAVWSETMMPPLNDEAIQAHRRALDQFGSVILPIVHDTERARNQISGMARLHGTAFLVGGAYAADLVQSGDFLIHTGGRNSAYFFDRTGKLVDRFDKIHLVPFGEFIPFQQSFPALYRLLLSLGPPNMERYQLARGDRATLFSLSRTRGLTTQPSDSVPWRFVTTICFEDTDGDLNARLLRGGGGRGSLGGSAKRADFIVNITNDGWFAFNEMPQHLQVATFRSIENRVPTVRSVNTGISAFIDSLGRTGAGATLPSGRGPAGEGTLARPILLDSRTTFFTRWGDLLGPVCAIVTAGLTLRAILAAYRRRRSMRRPAAA